MKIKRITKVAKTSPHSAYYLYSAAVKHELTYMQRIGIGKKMIKETAKELKVFAESLVGQYIRDKNVMNEIANPIRFGGLAINASNLMEESRELFLRGVITTNDLKTKLIMQDPTLRIK